MSTFQHHSQDSKRKKSKSFLQNKNNCQMKTLCLTQKGLNQAHRNDSKEIWKSFYNFQQETQAQTQRQYQIHEGSDQKGSKQFQRSPLENQIQQHSKQSQKDNQMQNERIKSHKKNQKNSSTKVNKNKNKNTLKDNKSKAQQNNQTKNEQSYLKKMNQQIVKHLQSQKYCSRELSNSAFAKLYNSPCIQAYGYKNTSKTSQITKNLLKTHNITPHTCQNNPQFYQTYGNAIKNAKRTKLSEQNKQQRIRRQFLKWFDDSIVQQAQLELNSLNKQKRAKSLQNLRVKKKQFLADQDENSILDKKQKRKSLKELLKTNQPLFVYKYKQSDGSVKLAKDRHGLTCYIDSSFSHNKKVLLDFEIKQNPILPDKVKPQDTNLDKIRRQNYQKSVQQNYPGHYMTPCVVTPYDRSKYQFRKNRAQSISN